MKKKIKTHKPKAVRFREKKPFFSEKEIVFRSNGRARVLKISSFAQVIMLGVFFAIGAWSFYSNYMYKLSGSIISTKDDEITATRDAYVNLMSEFMALHQSVDSMIDSIDKKSLKNQDLNKYKQQAEVFEDKIKQMADDNDWINPDDVTEKVAINEAIFQRDLAVSERDILRQRVDEMQEIVQEIKNVEMDVLNQVSAVTGGEINKIKSAISSVNSALKEKDLYFNPLANKKTDSQGGPYIPLPVKKLNDKKIEDKVSSIMEDVENLKYYKEAIKTIPVGKPVWSYWLTSKFGERTDPFRKEGANHKGVDLASRTGNKVKSMAGGKVLRAEFSGAYGNLVEVDHGNGFKTKYAHLHKIYVEKGDALKSGDVVGEVGSTGRSTGSHLHYEVLYQNVNVDPLAFIQAKL